MKRTYSWDADAPATEASDDGSQTSEEPFDHGLYGDVVGADPMQDGSWVNKEEMFGVKSSETPSSEFISRRMAMAKDDTEKEILADIYGPYVREQSETGHRSSGHPNQETAVNEADDINEPPISDLVTWMRNHRREFERKLEEQKREDEFRQNLRNLRRILARMK